MNAAARIEAIYLAALKAVDPRAAVRGAFHVQGSAVAIGDLNIGNFGRVLVVAIGKAAAGMALGALDVLGAEIDQGIIVTKDGMLGNERPPGFQCFEAGHPIPDHRGVAATRAVLRAVRELDDGDLLIALISGGGSALLESPVSPLTLDDIQQTTRLLLRAGAPIDDLNTVRSVLSDVKGGGLRRAAGGAVVASLILSDVLGNDPAVIASGPTILAMADHGAAEAVLCRYGVMDRVQENVREVIRQASANQRDKITADRDIWRIIADNRTFLEGAEAAARHLGLRPTILWRDKEGEAADLAREFVAACDRLPDDIDVVLGGGETTVTVRGTGVGGRNTEFALAAAIALDRTKSPWHVASLASDGDDAETGAAGAIANVETVALARARGVDPVLALADNDSARVFAVAGGLVTSGPTGTNVNDLYIAVRDRENAPLPTA